MSKINEFNSQTLPDNEEELRHLFMCDELIFNGDLNFSELFSLKNRSIIYSPINLIVNGNLDVSWCKFLRSPEKLIVNGSVNLSFSDFVIPSGSIITEDIIAYGVRNINEINIGGSIYGINETRRWFNDPEVLRDVYLGNAKININICYM